MGRHKYKVFKTADSRHGPGRVHRVHYNSLNKAYYLACRSSPTTGINFSIPHGQLDTDGEVTCRRCPA